MDTGNASDGFKPPYNVVWSTFLHFLDRTDPATLPPKIDRSYLTTLSGSTQTYLLSALRSFELIGPEKEVTSALKELVKDPDGRPAMIADLLQRYYPHVVELGKNNGTVLQLDDAFRKYGLSGNTIRKAAAFYMHAAQYAGLPLSVHWTVRKAGSGHRAEPAAGKRSRKPQGKPPAGPRPETRAPTGDSRSLKLRSGSTITLALSAPVLSLPREDRAFLLEIIEKMEDYEERIEVATSGSKPDGTSGSTPEE
jgi:hypothetical protein